MKTVSRARRSVIVVGWDIHTQTVLAPDGEGRGIPLGRFLQQTLKQQPELEIYLLEWDFSVLYALERDWTPLFNRSLWSRDPHLHFHFDDHHEWTASQHQKIVVIDDAVAFTGGIDLTIHRWDTPEHTPRDPRRVLPNGEAYDPFHDLQIAVEGRAASALGDLVRERWRKATGKPLDAPRATRSPWPDELHADLEDVDVAIARTIPASDPDTAVREVERACLDGIAAARQVIYIENQYFTSPAIANALAARLSETRGPEVVLVLPNQCSGWLEQSTMDALRVQQLSHLYAHDPHGRLRAVAPWVEARGVSKPIHVHAKVVVIDDRLLRIGSSNLSRRSMGFDSECDVLLEAAAPQDRTAAAIRHLRLRLVGEHLGMATEEVSSRLEQRPSLVALIDAAKAGSKRLERIAVERDDVTPVLEAALIDPNSPEAPSRVAREFWDRDVPRATRSPWIKAAVALCVVSLLAAAWRWTPLTEWARPARLADLALGLREHSLAPLIVTVGYALASLAMVPLTALLIATALVFDTWLGIGYSLAGASAGGCAGYAAGHLLGRDTVRRLAGERLNSVSEKLARRGVAAVFALRVLPVAPFTIVNLVIGASHVRLRDFVVGTLLGLLPGVVAINLFETNVHQAITDTDPGNILFAALVLIGAILLLATLRRILNRRGEDGR